MGFKIPYLGTIAQLIGGVLGDNANAGNVGEYISSNLVIGSAVSLVSGTAKTVTSIALTPGDWDIITVAHFIGATTTTVSQLEASISFTNNSIDTTTNRFWQFLLAVAATIFTTGSTVPFSSAYIQQRTTSSTSVTVFLTVSATFGTSTCSAFGHLAARRRR